MQLIFFLLVLFAIGCVMYGVSAGVQTVERGVKRVIQGMRPCTTTDSDLMPPSSHNETPSARRGIDELQKAFTLYQTGALTQEEFDGLKSQILARIKTETSTRN